MTRNLKKIAVLLAFAFVLGCEDPGQPDGKTSTDGQKTKQKQGNGKPKNPETKPADPAISAEHEELLKQRKPLVDKASALRIQLAENFEAINSAMEAKARSDKMLPLAKQLKEAIAAIEQFDAKATTDMTAEQKATYQKLAEAQDQDQTQASLRMGTAMGQAMLKPGVGVALRDVLETLN